MTLPRLMTLKAAAEALGGAVSDRTLYAEHRAGRLRCAKVGRALLTDYEALQAWWSHRCHDAENRPASTCESGVAVTPYGSSRTRERNIPQGAARAIALGLKRA